MKKSSEDEGESSSTDQATCKDDSEDGRPLKKARYIWQIKGKYHLRDKDRKIHLPAETRGESETVPVDYKSFSPVYCGNEESYDIGERTMEPSPCEALPVDESPAKCPSPLQDIEEVIKEDSTACEVPNADPNAPIKDTTTSHGTPPLRFVVDKESAPTSPRSSSCCFRSFLHSVNRSSLQVRKWQTKQLAKGIVDNTINKVLEDMGFVPLPEDAEDVFNEPIQCHDSHQNFENEAVLMAIQSHGLQRNELEPTNTQGSDAVTNVNPFDGSNNSGIRGISSNSKCVNETTTRRAPCACTLPQVIADIDLLDKCEPFTQKPGDNFNRKFALSQAPFNMNEIDGIDGKWIHDFESTFIPLPFSNERYALISNSSSDDNTDSDDSFVKLDYEDENGENFTGNGFEDNRPCDIKMSENDSLQDERIDLSEKPIPLEHDDFLDQAVAVAIQKKGLSVFGCMDNG